MAEAVPAEESPPKEAEPPSTICRFLDILPAELRLSIYEHVFSDFNPFAHGYTKPARSALSILATNHRIRRESMRAFYTRVNKVVADTEEAWANRQAQRQRDARDPVERMHAFFETVFWDGGVGEAKEWRERIESSMEKEGFPVEEWKKGKK